MKFKIGDKVRIKSKSIGTLLPSALFRYAGEEGYITKINGDGSGVNEYNCLVADTKPNTNTGDFFAPQDLELIPISDEPINFEIFNYGLEEAIKKGEIQVGDDVRVLNSSECWDYGKRFFKILEIDDGYIKNGFKEIFDPINTPKGCGCSDLSKPFELKIKINKSEGSSLASKIGIEQQTFMSKLTAKIIRTFSKDDRQLFKAGLIDESNKPTAELREIVLNDLVNDYLEKNKKDYVELAKEINDEKEEE